jgi:hypothetical protein
MYPFLLALTLSAGAPLAPGAAGSSNAGRTSAPAAGDSERPETARAECPLGRCVVSAEDLGATGGASDYLHQREGKPGRLTRLCFAKYRPKPEQDPVKHLRLADGDAAGATKH